MVLNKLASFGRPPQFNTILNTKCTETFMTFHVTSTDDNNILCVWRVRRNPFEMLCEAQRMSVYPEIQ